MIVELPLESIDPNDWRVYRDWCIDQRSPQEYVELLWYIVQGLELRPAAALKGYHIDGGSELWWLVATRIDHPDYRPAFWVMQPNGPPGTLSTPAHFPDIGRIYPAVAWDYFCKVAAVVMCRPTTKPELTNG